ncbi:MAG TPA: LysR family transcriptional regulator [Amaricoccus sp.]|nr:LysR family transcriptional regulator [Amaricoccus sp.]
MDLRQLRCAVVAAEEMHFGRAAVRLEMLPAALGRAIRQLEDGLGVALFERTTRSVAVTPEGARILAEARRLLAAADAAERRWRRLGRKAGKTVRLGAMDSAASGLVPALLADLARAAPDLRVQLVEDRSIRLLPKLLAGSLDLALVRPSLRPFHRRLRAEFLLYETPILMLPATHALAALAAVPVAALAETPMIVPDRRSRPHSHDLVLGLFDAAGASPLIIQNADEKQTMLNMVAAGIGGTIAPRWWSSSAPAGVVTRELALADLSGSHRLPLYVVWPKDIRDDARDRLVEILRDGLDRYGQRA